MSKINKCLEKNMQDQVAILTQLAINQKPFVIIGEDEIKKALKELGLESELFNDLSIGISPCYKDEENFDECSSLIFCDYGNSLSEYYPFIVLQGSAVFGEMSNYCYDELKKRCGTN